MKYLILLLAWVVTSVTAQEITSYTVYDREPSMRVLTQDGKEFMCLITGEGFGFTGDYENWFAFTCIRVGVQPAFWQFCRGKRNEPLFQCVPPGTNLQGAKVESPDKPDYRLYWE